MNNEGGKVSPEFLFFAAIVFFIAAIVIYLRKEDNSYANVAEGVKATTATAERVERENKDLKIGIDAMLSWQQKQMELNDKTLQRLQLIEMRLDSQPKAQSVVHKDAPMPQPLKVELTTPIKVIYREARPTVPALPKGKQNGKPASK
jgi:hypothetical protein